jgi:hypothetical protein
MDFITPRRPPFGHGITARNVNEALPLALDLLRSQGLPACSRGINTIRLNGPLSTVYVNPMERVLFDQHRNANPFFHLIEALWILSGSNTAALPGLMLPSLLNYSDNGRTFHGAYGYRLAHAFGFDQLETVIHLLQKKPDTRQAVLSIWHPELDLGAGTKDTPCNDMIMLDIVDEALNMTVCNRSNDAIWGAYGANAVQFSVLQEWLASSIGVGVGYYVQQSNNLHIYPDNPFWIDFLADKHDAGHVTNPYISKVVCPKPLARSPAEASLFRKDCMALNYEAEHGAGLRVLAEVGDTEYFQTVVSPMLYAYAAHRDGDYRRAWELTHAIQAEDWRLACTQWVDRRALSNKSKEMKTILQGMAGGAV